MVDLSPITYVQVRATEYVSTLPDEVLRGNVFAIVIFLFLLYIAIYIIQKFTTLLVFVLKKVFLLIIVVLAFYEFARIFVLKIAIEGLTADTIIFGIAGTVVGIVAIIIALYVAFRSVIKLQKAPSAERELPIPAEQEESLPLPVAGENFEPKEKESARIQGEPPDLSKVVKDNLSIEALKSDKRIGAVIAYIIIAEFGVFSSKTIAAPTIQAGLMFFVAFFLASVVFIRLTYHDYWRGLRHLAAALCIGGVLSVILGYFWGGIPLDQLLSLSYFTTDALVALITGLALSLFMGSMR